MTHTSDPDLENDIVFVYDSDPAPIFAEDSSPTLPATPRALVLAGLHAPGESN